jgi:hypothetical protein
MLRIVARETDYTLTQVNGACHESMRTFDVEAPEIEAWLSEFVGKQVWVTRSLLAIEWRSRPAAGEE